MLLSPSEFPFCKAAPAGRGWLAHALYQLDGSDGAWGGIEQTIATALPGRALLGNYPKVDMWDELAGHVVSIKSVDLDLPSYQNANAFGSAVRRFADDLHFEKSLSGKAADGGKVVIDPSDVKIRELVLVTPRPLPDSFLQAIGELLGVMLTHKVQ